MGLPIIGGTSGETLEVEAGTKAARVTLRGVDYGILGSYAKGLQSGVIAAGVATSAVPLWAFRYTGSKIVLVRRVRFSAAAIATAFAAGVGRFDLFAARAFSASDSGGTAATFTGNQSKLRTSMATFGGGDMRISSTAALTPGTRTLDTDPMGSIVAGVVATAGVGIIPPGSVLWEAKPGELPHVLVNNEGLVIQGTVPATGTMGIAVDVEFDEVDPADWD